MDQPGKMEKEWYLIENVQDVSSPVLIIYPDRILDNIRKMISVAGGAANLRPHVKTHKMPEIVRLQISMGINKFKCATIAEAEMTLRAGAPDILLAVQPVGPNIGRFFRLKQEFPDARISCIVDSGEITSKLSRVAQQTGLKTGVMLDINVGMNRTGILPDDEAVDLFRSLSADPMINPIGLHAYDGHIHESDPGERSRLCNEAYAPVEKLLKDISTFHKEDLTVVAGGTPTFPVHALRKGVETSPGTVILWDYGYSSSFTDLQFMHSAVLLTRVVSKPAPGLICLDLGHKALASEMPHPRVMLYGLGNYTITGHNEEHLVVRTDRADSFSPGDVIYGIPWHICPTVDRYDSVIVVRDRRAVQEWDVEARRRRISI